MSNIPENQESLGEKLEATDRNDSDVIFESSKLFASFIPVLGPVAVYFIDTYIGPPTTKRMRNFLNGVVKDLEELKLKFDSVNVETPVFQTTFMQTWQIAARTHREEKLEALRNVVLNSSIPSSIEDDVLAIFLNWIDGFTALHISTLKLLHFPGSCTQNQLSAYFPRLEQNRAVYNQVLKDLEDKGLINLKYDLCELSEEERKMKTSKDREDIDDILSANSLFGRLSKTTELGEQFIEFIEYPLLPS